MNLYSEDYEKYILGTMLVDNDKIDSILSSLKEEYFYNAKTRYIFKVLCEEWKTNKCVTIISLVNKCSSVQADYIADLTSVITTTENWQFYCNEMKKMWIARTFPNEIKSSVERMTTENITEVISELNDKVNGLLKFENDKSKSAKNLCMELTQNAMEAFKNKSPYDGMDCGFENINEMYDGVPSGKLIIWGARPSIGKTSLAIQVAKNISKLGISTDFVSYETSALGLFRRLVAIESGLTIKSIKRGWFQETQSQIQKYQIAMNNIYNLPLNILDETPKDENALYAHIRYMAKTQNTKVFFIDHLGLIPFSDSSKNTNTQLDLITRELHKMCLELDITIICLCQLNRSAEGQKPNLAQLRDSGTIEQNADIISFIHRDRATATDVSEIQTEFITVKNRDGDCGTVDLMFMPKYTKFIEIKKQGVA